MKHISRFSITAIVLALAFILPAAAKVTVDFDKEADIYILYYLPEK